MIAPEADRNGVCDIFLKNIFAWILPEKNDDHDDDAIDRKIPLDRRVQFL
jgi:hypothetical protein